MEEHFLQLKTKKNRYIANKVSDENLSVRETEKLVKSILNPKKKSEKRRENSFVYENLERKIKTIMGTNVSINRKKRWKR